MAEQFISRRKSNAVENSTVAPRPETIEYLRTRPRGNCKLRQMLAVPIKYFVADCTHGNARHSSLTSHLGISKYCSSISLRPEL